MIICIIGPTAVGKTKLSEELAKKYNAIVINSDAMQVYRELNIGTAKIKPEEMEVKEHFLFDIKNPDEDYSVYDYQSDIRTLLEKYKNRNIVIVGGTGLYLKAALFNYEFTPILEKNEYAEYSNEELYSMLEKKGLSDEVHVNNRRRLVSKLNSGSSNNLKDELMYKNVLFIGLTTDRENLYNRINNRVLKMMDEGLLEEVKNLYSKYGKVKSLKTGIGYKELIDYLDGNCSLKEAIELIQKNSRHYAKRQYTWFNHQMTVKWFQTDYNNFENTVNQVCEYIEDNMK